MLNLYAIGFLGFLYVVASVWALYRQHQALPPDSVRAQYPLSTRALVMVPFVSQEGAGIRREHLEQFRAHRKRTWVFWGIFIGAPQAFYLFLLGIVLLRTRVGIGP